MVEPPESSPVDPAPAAAGPLVEVAAGLVFRHGQLLITQRYADAHLGGLWEFPGGKREPAESYQACLSRELQEELGVEVDVHEVIETIQHHYPDKSVLLKFFRCTWRRHEPRALGCAACRWIDSPELNDYAFPAADARLLDLLRRRPDLWR